MRSCKKKKKGTRTVKKYVNGGVTGDPKKVEDLLSGLNAFGVDDSDPLQNTFDSDEWYKKYGSGAISSGPPIDLALALGVAPGGVLATAGEAAYPILSNAASKIFQTELLGVSGATLENVINAGFASHGATHLPGNVQEFIENPSWEGAGNVGMNILELVPAVGPAIKTYVKGLFGTSSSPIKLADAAASTETSVKATEAKMKLEKIVAEQINVHKKAFDAGTITLAQRDKAIAKVIQYNNEMMKQPGYFERVLESVKVADEAATADMFSGMMARSKGVEQYGYMRYNHTDMEEEFVLFGDASTTALKMIEEMKAGGNDVLKRAIGLTKAELGKVDGVAPRGKYITDKIRGFTSNRRPNIIQGEDVFSTAEIQYLNTLSEEQLLKTLAHEMDHAQKIPFMSMLMDNYYVTQFTRVDDIIPSERILSIQYGKVRPGSVLESDLISSAGFKGGKAYEDLRKNYQYMLEPEEIIARLTEIKFSWWEAQQGVKGGEKMSDWAYKWTPEKTKRAYNIWDEHHPLLNVMKGKTEAEKFESLTNLLNKVLTPGLPIGGAAVINAVADPQVGATQYNMGGFVTKKERPRGMNIRKLR